MATIEIGTFTRWKMTDQEILSGSILSYPQKQVLQNELANIADQILGLIFDPLNPHDFVQQQAFLSGQMSIIRVQLDRSDVSEKQLSSFNQSNFQG